MVDHEILSSQKSKSKVSSLTSPKIWTLADNKFWIHSFLKSTWSSLGSWHYWSPSPSFISFLSFTCSEETERNDTIVIRHSLYREVNHQSTVELFHKTTLCNFSKLVTSYVANVMLQWSKLILSCYSDYN